MVDFKEHAKASSQLGKKNPLDKPDNIILGDMEYDDVQIPEHYNWIPGHECNDVTQHFSFNIGNAIKYLWRHKHKGTAIKDLRKAKWYIDSEIKRLEKV